MPKQKKHTSGKPHYMVDIAIILPAVIFLSFSLIYFRLDISITLVLLFGVWTLDSFIKKSYGFSNETVFADLSFSSFIFVGSQGVNLISTHPILPVDTNNMARVGILAFILMLLWLGNLSICRNLIDAHWLNDKKSYWGLWGISCFFALISIIGAIIPQILKIM